jgi:hypothetical protein
VPALATKRHQLARRNVTDRALRYRANATPPPGPKQCCLCGNPKGAEVGHVNGHEEDTDKRNLFWTCRSCNVKSANAMRKAGMGRLTKQYNPANEGAQSLGAWMNAVSSIKGEGGTMAVPEAVALIHATSPEDRSKFAREIWAKRRARGTDKVVPFGGKMRNAKPGKKKNFGKPYTMSSSRLSRDAFNQGYLGKKDFQKWLDSTAKSDSLHPSFIRELKAEYSKGESQRNEDEKRAKELKLLKEQRRETKAPAVPKDTPLKDLSQEYAGRTIKRTARGFEVLGETWTSAKQAKEYVDLYNASGGKLRPTRSNPRKAVSRKISKVAKTVSKRVIAAGKALAGKKNPTASLTQGKSVAYVVEMGHHKHHAEVNAADGKRDSHTFTGPGSFKSAMSWARLRLHDMATAINPAGWKLFPLSQKPRKSNPEDASVRMYEKFHGTPSTEVLEYQEQVHRHEWLGGIGPLVEMKVRNIHGNRDVQLNFPEPDRAKPGSVVMLTIEESGTQLYATGGDQQLDLRPNSEIMSKFGMKPLDVRDNMLVGTILEITYRTRKKFEKQGKEDIDFFHVLGKEGSQGVYPVLLFHPRSSSIEIAGGRYYVGPVAKSLGASPGIIG